MKIEITYPEHGTSREIREIVARHHPTALLLGTGSAQSRRMLFMLPEHRSSDLVAELKAQGCGVISYRAV